MMLMLLMQTLPPPPLRAIPDPTPTFPAYAATCVVKDKNDRAFSVTLSATGSKRSRRIQINSSDPTILPNGEFHSKGARRSLFIPREFWESIEVGQRRSVRYSWSNPDKSSFVVFDWPEGFGGNRGGDIIARASCDVRIQEVPSA
jgi:hypothetical protein